MIARWQSARKPLVSGRPHRRQGANLHSAHVRHLPPQPANTPRPRPQSALVVAKPTREATVSLKQGGARRFLGGLGRGVPEKQGTFGWRADCQGHSSMKSRLMGGVQDISGSRKTKREEGNLQLTNDGPIIRPERGDPWNLSRSQIAPEILRQSRDPPSRLGNRGRVH